MDKSEYRELLKRKEWINKRNLILKRDKYKCVKCNCNKKLHVHHTYYLVGKMPWQVPDECLVTLCNLCHEKEHKGRYISTFVRKSPPKSKYTKDKTVKNRKDKKPPIKLKKLRFYRFIALKSKTLNKVYDKTTDKRDIKEIAKLLGGEIKGFDDKNLAENWIR